MIADIFINLTVNQCKQKRLADIIHTVQDVVVIVDIDQSDNQFLLFIQTFILHQFGIIKHVQGIQVALVVRNNQQIRGRLPFNMNASDLNSKIFFMNHRFQFRRFLLVRQL